MHVDPGSRSKMISDLVLAFSEDPTSVDLVRKFPREDGRGEEWSHFADILDEICLRTNMVSIDTLSIGSSAEYHMILAECIKATKSRIGA